MEQQTVTIAKAGIHASLNARCSVLAAANPVYGQYDRSRRPQENIGLPDSLLSRFDLLFIVLDQLDPILDKRISEHVVKSHQYRKPGTLMEPEPLNQKSKLILDTFDKEEETLMYLRATSKLNDKNSNNNTAMNNNNKNNNEDLLTQEFLRKYIHFAKNRITPTLSDEAMELISTAYATMRSKQSQRTLPVTARSLETIIRLSNASAKCRLSQSVDEEDVEVALELINYVLYHEIGSEVDSHNNNIQLQQLMNKSNTNANMANKENINDSNKRPRLSLDESTNNELDDSNNNNNISTNTPTSRYLSLNNNESITVYSDEEVLSVEININSDRYNLVGPLIAYLNNENTHIEVIQILNSLNEHISIVSSGQYFTLLELQAILTSLQRENKVRNYCDLYSLLLAL